MAVAVRRRSAGAPRKVRILTVPAPDQPRSGPSRWTGRRRRVVLRVLSLVLTVGVLVGVVPRLADLAAAVRMMSRLDTRWVLALVALAAAALVAAWVALARLIGGVTVVQAGIAHSLSTCVANTVPAGGAVAVAVNLRVYGTFGCGVAQTTQGLLAMGFLDNTVKVVLPLLAGALTPVLPGALRLPPGEAVTAGIAAAVSVALAVVVLRSERLIGGIAAWLEAVFRRGRRPGRWRSAAVGYQRGLRSRLVRSGPSAAVAVLAGHVLQVALLVVALRSVGVPPAAVGVADATITYALVRLVTVLPVTPGGLGVAELGLIGALGVAAGGHFPAQVAAAVLLYRGLTYLPPIVLAGPAWLVWRLRRIRGNEPRDKGRRSQESGPESGGRQS